MKLSIILVSYNTSDLLHNCLFLVYQALSWSKLGDKSELIVVDNASRDGSYDMVKKDFPKVKLIVNHENHGFAKANNQGIKQAKGEYVLLLNSDTEITKDTLSFLLGKLGKNQEIGVLGPKLINKDGTFQQSVGYFPTLTKVFYWMSFIDDLPYLSSILKPYHMQNRNFYKYENEVDWVSGACILVRKKAIEKAGLLDERIFMYGEEVEWCYRIKKAGFKVFYTPGTEVTHLKGASGEGRVSGIVEEFAALKYFYNKHRGKFAVVLLKLFLMFGALFRLVLFGIIAGDKAKTETYAKAFHLS